MSTQVIVKLDEDELRYDFGALAAYEEATGESVYEILQAADRVSATRIRALIWAGLLWAHPKITVEEVGSQIPTTEGLSYYTKAIEALGEALSPAEDAKVDDEVPGDGEAGVSTES